MSTKIYNGLQVVDRNSDIFELVQQVATIAKTTFQKLSEELVAKELAKFVDSATFRDAYDAGNPPENLQVFFETQRQWEKENSGYGEHSALNDPLRFEIVFGKTVEGKLLANLFISHDLYKQDLLDSGLFEDYHYQNSTDKPKHISEEAWEQRRKDWDTVLDSSGTFDNLVSWRLSDSNYPFSEVIMTQAKKERYKSIEEYVSSENRLHNILFSTLYTTVLNHKRTVIGEEWLDSVNIMEEFRNCQKVVADFLATDEGKKIDRPKVFTWSNVFGKWDIEPYVMKNSLLQKLQRKYGMNV